MSRTQFHGIKFPINVTSDENTLFDLNISKKELVRSELMHVIFTPQGQRLRDPLFGTNLIRVIFSPNNRDTWSAVVSEVRDIVRKFVPDCEVESIVTDVADDGEGLFCTINYKVKEADGTYSADSITTTL